MKKINYIFACLVMMMSLMSLSSCDMDYEDWNEVDDYCDDRTLGKVLCGDWEGDFGMETDDTKLQFYPAKHGKTYGSGIQVDTYKDSEKRTDFEWEIQDGVIYITYPSDSDLDCKVHSYHLTKKKFTGYFGNSNNEFSLRKESNYYKVTPAINYYRNY